MFQNKNENKNLKFQYKNSCFKILIKFLKQHIFHINFIFQIYASRACFISAKISSISSIPIDNLIKFAPMPTSSNCASDNCL